MIRALVFPGQGSQVVGMGRELAAAFPAARQTLEEVDDALRQKLARLMAEGPESELMLTENAQPALMAVSLAALRALEAEGGFDLPRHATLVAGHSLGEYSALAAAGSIAIADAARLLKRRGLAMQRAVPMGEGAMAALLGVEVEAAREIATAAREGEVCDVANDNGGSQVVISGAKAAVERAIKLAPEHGARRSILLPVSAPFHCALMAPAAREMEEALAAVALQVPLVPLIANVTGEAVEDPEQIRRLLVEQVTGLVRWRESVLTMKSQGIDTVVELGAGRVLSGLAKRIDRELKTMSVGTPAEIEALLKTI